MEISTDFALLIPQSNTERCPKRGDVVKIGQKSSEARECVILGRADKAGGRHKFWFNVEYVEPANLTGKQESIDFSKVYWDKVEINTVFMTATEDVLEKARTEEYKKLSFWDVFEEIQDNGQQQFSSRWLYSEKNDGKVKARLVARGFEDVERSNLVKNSSTCSRDAFRAFLGVASTMSKWIFGSLDVKSVFLQGTRIKKSVIL